MQVTVLESTEATMMNERDWKRLKTLYKKHVRMAEKIGWRVYKSNALRMWCPFWHDGINHKDSQPPFAFNNNRDGYTREWNEAVRLWSEAEDTIEGRTRLRREFGWRN